MKLHWKRILSACIICVLVALTATFYLQQHAKEVAIKEAQQKEALEQQKKLEKKKQLEKEKKAKEKAEAKKKKEAEEKEKTEEEEKAKEEAAQKATAEAQAAQEAAAQPYRVLIDPGHYAGSSLITFDDGSTFSEGDYTLVIAQNLQAILQANGIQADMTRAGGTITIGGLSNYDLDSTNISARGAMSRGYDLFVSIHTNSNDYNVNGYPTFEQPININKPLVIINSVALGNQNVINMANDIGGNLTQTLINNGLSSGAGFSYGSIVEWTPDLNNALDVGGVVCTRGNNYYGVLRGSANVGTPGMIIEHGYHSNPDFRNQLVNGNLAYQLAAADASAIIGHAQK